MFKKITKNLIIFFGVIIFSFALVNSVYASSIPYAFSGDSYDNDLEYGNSVDSNNNSNSVYSRYDYLGQAYPNAYSNNSSVSQNKATPTVVNNYYYSTTPKTSTNTSTTVKNNTTNTQKSASDTSGNIVRSDGATPNYLGASAYDGGNLGASSLGNRSSGFMPNTIWGWILVVMLILAIVILARMIARKAKADKVIIKTV